MKRQQPQVQQDRTKLLTEFIKEGQVNLKHGETYNLTSMVYEHFVLYSSDTVAHFSYLYGFIICIVSGVDKLYGSD
jgi:hypothetical protein